MTNTRSELLSLIGSWDVTLPDGFDDDTPLISSGVIDSLALFDLLAWIEKKTGRAVDPSAVDLAASWDSVRLILYYLDGCGSPGPSQTAAHGVATSARSRADIRIVRYTPQHKAAVAELQTELWSPNATLNRTYLEWKYEQNPYGSEPTIYLALDRDEIVGMRGFYPSRWEAGSPAQEADVLVADDLVLRSDHRNEGLATQIMREAFADLRRKSSGYVFNLAGGRLTVLGSLAMGWRSAGRLAPAARATIARRARVTFRNRLRRLSFAWRYADHAVFATASEREPFAHVDGCPGPHRTANGVTVRVEAEPRPREMAALVERQGHDGRLRHLRDEAYFHWRFRDPRNEYRFFLAGDNALEGYLVVGYMNAFADARARVNIVDVEADEPRIRSALLEAAVHMGRFSEIVVWTATLDPGFRDDLTRFAFRPIYRPLAHYGGPHILVRPVDDARLQEDWQLNGVHLLDLENWDMRMIYSMGG